MLGLGHGRLPWSNKVCAAWATGVFGAFFGRGVDAVTEALMPWQVAGLAAASGFFGSLFGNTVTRKR